MLGHHPGVGRRSGTMEGGLKRCPFKAMANDYHVVGSVRLFSRWNWFVGIGLVFFCVTKIHEHEKKVLTKCQAAESYSPYEVHTP